MAHPAVAGYTYRALVAAGGACLIVTGVLAFAVPHLYGSAVAQAWAWGAVAPLYLVGLVAVMVRPDHLSARWLGAAGSLLAIETAVRRVMQVGEVGIPWSVAGTVVFHVATLATAAGIASVLVVFPDDQYRSLSGGGGGGVMCLSPPLISALLLVSQRSLYFGPTWTDVDDTNPLFVSGLSGFGTIAETGFRWRVVLWAVGVAAMVVRYWHASLGAR